MNKWMNEWTKNFNRRSSHGHHGSTEEPRTGATPKMHLAKGKEGTEEEKEEEEYLDHQVQEERQ